MWREYLLHTVHGIDEAAMFTLKGQYVFT